MNSHFFRIVLVAFLVFCFAGGLLGQSTSAEVTGRITDPSGAVIPGASITVLNVDTGIERTTTSNDQGHYTVPLLQPGTYRITAQKEGFRPVSRSGIKLYVAQTTRVDFALEVGTVTETVTVQEDAPMVQTETAESSSTITTREYDRLPLIQQGRIRNPASFIYLTPGVHGNVSSSYYSAGADYTGATNQIHLHGSQLLSTELQIDGVAAGQTRQVGNFTEMAPPVDAVREFKVTSSQMSAEYGHTGAGVVSFQLKSGTNEFHGSVYEYLRNDKLDAREWLTADRTLTRQNEFGFTVGGPVMIPKVYDGKNRTFFMFSYAGSRKRGATSTQRIQIPTAANARGDFSDLIGTTDIYDPATTRSDGTGGFIRDPFPSNVIPLDRLDPVAVNVANYLPAPNLTGSGNLNYQGSTGETMLDPDVFTVKIDHALNNRQHISGSFNKTDIPRRRVNSPLPLPLTDTTLQHIQGHTIRLSHDYFLSPNVMNQLTLGYNRFRHNFAQWTEDGAWPAQLGLAGVPGSAFPRFTFTGGYSAFSATYAVSDVDQQYVLKDTLSYIRGDHTMKFGVEHRRPQPNPNRRSNTSGTFNFSHLETALPGATSSTGDSFASFLLGNVHSANVSFPEVSGPRRPYWGFFVQDDVKLTPRLTLNLGFRFEFEQAAYEAADRASSIELGLPNPAAGNLPGAMIFAGSGPGRTGSRSFVDTDYSGFGPRIGVAYQLNPKTVVRAGYGIYYSNNYLELGTAGFNISGSFQSTDNGITPAFFLRDGFPQNFRQEPAIDPTFLNGQSGGIVEQSSAAMPRTQNWSFSIQRELSPNTQLEASYVGTRGTRQVATQLVELNQLEPKYLELGPLLTKNINSPEAQAAGIPIPYPGFNGSVAQALRPFPQYQSLGSGAAKAGNSIYHAMTLNLRKRLSYGLTLNAHYTLSKNIGYTASALPGGAGLDNFLLQDNYNRKLERSILPIDVTHATMITYVYELPLGPGKKFLDVGGTAGKLLEGWSVSGIHRYQSGTPLQVYMNNNLPIFNRVLRPDRVPGQPAASGISNGYFEPSRDRMFNLAGYAAPAPFRFGTAPPTVQDLRTFPVLSEDFSLIKRTKITEQTSLELYGQFINAFNRHRFANPDNNFSSGNFGRIRAVSLPRQIQIGLRLRF